MRELFISSKDCSFSDVTNEVYREVLLGDTFINGKTNFSLAESL